jgi:hypothetical protein
VKPARAPDRQPRPSRDLARKPQSDLTLSDRYGVGLAGLFAAVGALLLVLSAAGRGWPFLLGGIDFLVVAAVLYWSLRSPLR